MIRDMDLLRKVVLAIEEQDEVNSYSLKIDGYDQDEIAYHCLLLNDEGLIEVADSSFRTHEKYHPLMILRLRSEGHDFARTIKDEPTWVLAKKMWSVTKTLTLSALLAKLKEMAETGITEHSAALLEIAREAGIRM